MSSVALHDSVVVILMLPAPEYPIALTLRVCGAPFLSSRLLILSLASKPLGLSLFGIGGLILMIRHLGSVAGEGVVPWWGACKGFAFCVGEGLLVACLAAMEAHVELLMPCKGMASVAGSRPVVGGVGQASSSLILLV